MQTIDGNLVYSATDLVGFLACEHLPNLERAVVAGDLERPMRRDAELDRIAQRGIQHEHRFLLELEGEARKVVNVDSPDLAQSVERTRQAMVDGADVIYQGALFDGKKLGRPDFMLRVEDPSDLGPWSYEVWDTKLARHATASAVLQLCVYSDLLEHVQGKAPERMVLALGGSAQEKAEFRYADFSAYYRLVKADFERSTYGLSTTWPLITRPEPVEHCDVCRWNETCTKQLRAEDDLSLVAGISASQRRELRTIGTDTRGGLARMEFPFEQQLKGSRVSWEKVWNQARLQVEGDAAGKTLYELLPPARLKDGELEPKKGLLALPEPSEGDLFFDIEGDPFASDDGIDYLFGVIEPKLLAPDGNPTFHTFWSIENEHEVTPQAERKAFEAFIDLVMDRLEHDPNLHIYHYAPYEPGAMKRLMGRYGTREEEVDQLLRGEKFVDLYRVVRQGLRASVESYSIKKLERLYGFDRTVDLPDAGSSIAAFETWLELGGDVPDDPDILERIKEYNRDDCVSTWLLRDWLEGRRNELGDQLGISLDRPQVDDGEPDQELSDALKETQALIDQLVEGVAEDLESQSDADRAKWLLAQLLQWHRRENKSSWWRYYYLLTELTDEDRIEESDSLGGLVSMGQIGEERRSNIYRFSFPPQDHKIAVGTSPKDEIGQGVGTVVDVDDEAGTIDIRRGKQSPPPEPSSLIPFDMIPDKDLSRSLQDTARWVIEHGIDEQGFTRAGRDLLLRTPPSFDDGKHSSLRQEGETASDAARRLVGNLKESYLAVQGPPGSGKTTVGAEMIVDLVNSGKKVGVTANSHKVISNLLEKVVETAKKRGTDVRVGQRVSSDSDLGAIPSIRILGSPAEALAALQDDQLDVVGATAWQWCRADMVETVDYLFVDEAGQVSLANVIASAPSARNLVLLGDPQQLDQPLKGVHPPGAGSSALAHLLDGQSTMPPDRGLFLDGTWRLHPSVCAFTSEAFYDGRLHSNLGAESRSVQGHGLMNGSGLRFVPVEHEGHTSDSEEEATVIAEAIQQLLESEPVEIDEDGVARSIGADDVLVVTPYNAQTTLINSLLPSANVGTVDKFQGREAPISIYSMATSSPADAPRGMEFLYSLNRLNVATSRARCIAVVVGNPSLVRVRCRTPRQMRLANGLARFVEMAVGDHGA